MSLLDNSTSGKIDVNPMLAYYTLAGCGKTTFAASFPRPGFIDFEEGSYDFDLARRWEPESWTDLIKLLKEIHGAPKGGLDIESLVFDTADAIEVRMHIQLAEDAEKESIEDIGWQKGYQIALSYWAELIKICKQIRKKHNLWIVFLAHAVPIKREDLHLGARFSRYGMNLHPKASEYLFSQLDLVMFGKQDVSFKKQKGKDLLVAKDEKDIIAHTRLSCHWDAKNRYGLPERIVMPVRNGFTMLKSFIDKAKTETSEVVEQECYAAISRVKDQSLAKEMVAYVAHQAKIKDVRVMRNALDIIQDKIMEQENEEN